MSSILEQHGRPILKSDLDMGQWTQKNKNVMAVAPPFGVADLMLDWYPQGGHKDDKRKYHTRHHGHREKGTPATQPEGSHRPSPSRGKSSWWWLRNEIARDYGTLATVNQVIARTGIGIDRLALHPDYHVVSTARHATLSIDYGTLSPKP